MRARRTRAVANTESIVAAARRLLITRTEGFTIQELVREAGVGLPTFYRHFDSKDALLVTVLGDLIADAAEHYRVLGLGLDDPVERLRVYLKAMLATLADGPLARFGTSEYLRLAEQFPELITQASRPVVDLVRTAITDAAELGTLAPIDPERDAELITDLAITTYHRHAVTPSGTPDEVALHLTRFVLHGLGANRPDD